MDDNLILPNPNSQLILSSGVPSILENIRPQWKAKRLIERVRNLLASDPSSACQKILNAAVQDLREKIVLAGIDIAKEAVSQNKLPPISRPEDIEDYSVQNVINLSYYIGLLSRPEWRRVTRCYEIRRDLEHEDDEYEAGVEDCVYIFKTAIDVVLSKDPIQILSVSDIVELIDSPTPIMISKEYIEDYEKAPKVRQLDIMKLLIGKYVDQKSLEIVKDNSITAIKYLSQHTNSSTNLDLATFYQDIYKKGSFTYEIARVMNAAMILPYFRSAVKEDFFRVVLKQFKTISPHWRNNAQHGSMLNDLIEVGGLDNISNTLINDFILWLFQCYLGEPGGYGWGSSRCVFYSNSGAPLAQDILNKSKSIVKQKLEDDEKLIKSIQKCIINNDIQRRYDSLINDFQ
jgi:hypothetical protein